MSYLLSHFRTPAPSTLLKKQSPLELNLPGQKPQLQPPPQAPAVSPPWPPGAEGQPQPPAGNAANPPPQPAPQTPAGAAPLPPPGASTSMAPYPPPSGGALLSAGNPTPPAQTWAAPAQRSSFLAGILPAPTTTNQAARTPPGATAQAATAPLWQDSTVKPQPPPASAQQQAGQPPPPPATATGQQPASQPPQPDLSAEIHRQLTTSLSTAFAQPTPSAAAPGQGASVPAAQAPQSRNMQATLASGGRDAAAADELARTTLGVTYARGATLTPDATGTSYAIAHAGNDAQTPRATYATYDAQAGRIFLQDDGKGGLGEDARQYVQNAAANPHPSRLPIYYPGTPNPCSPAEVQALHQAGGQALQSTPEGSPERAAALARAGLSPQALQQQLKAGRLSVQQATELNQKYNGIQEVNSTRYGSRQIFGGWAVSESNPQRDWWVNGTPEQRAVVINHYFDELAQKAQGNLLADPERIEQLRRQTLGDEKAEWGRPGAMTPGQMPENGPAALESIPLKDGGHTLMPGGQWTVEDLGKVHENPAFAKATPAERDAVMNDIIGRSFADYSARPGFDQGAYQRFNQIAQQARDNAAALKTWRDTGRDAMNFAGNVVGGVVKPIVATATDSSFFEPDGTPRVPLGNVGEQAWYWGEKAKDTTQSFLPERWKLDADLESLHQDLINGSFPLNDRARLDEWLTDHSKGLTEAQRNWYEAVQGKPNTGTKEGLAQHTYTYANSLLNPGNAELVSKFIQTRDPAVWKELRENLMRTPQRAETEQAQDESLEKDKLVAFMNQNYPGGDWKEQMKSAGNPVDIASNFIPLARGLRAGKAAKAGLQAGRATIKSSAAALAKSAAINLGTGAVEMLIENPYATFAEQVQAGKENIATALGLHAAGHVAGHVYEKAKEALSAPDKGGAGTPPSADMAEKDGGSGSDPSSSVDEAMPPMASKEAATPDVPVNPESDYPHALDGDYRGNWKTSIPGRRVKLEDGREGIITDVAKDHTLTVDVNGKNVSGIPQQKVKMQLTPAELAAEQAFMNRHQSFQKLKPVYDQRLQDIAKSLPEAHVILAPLKGAPRALEKAGKAANTPGPNGKSPSPEKVISQLTDVLRGSIVVDSLDQVPQAATAVLRSFAPDAKQTGTTQWGAQIYQTSDGRKVIVNDRFKNPTAEGYSDVQIMLEMTPGHMVEIQIHIPEMLVAKEGDAVKKMGVPEKYWPENLPINGFDPKRTGHHMYEEKRSLPEDSANADSVAKEMKSLYQEAMDAHFKRK